MKETTTGAAARQGLQSGNLQVMTCHVSDYKLRGVCGAVDVAVLIAGTAEPLDRSRRLYLEAAVLPITQQGALLVAWPAETVASLIW